ncbi:peptide-methionine (S)-S-oxide reductase MsrA [Hymenobacter algoricola]|uniref:Peptide methionine sulfoxide reductase MsrA n=2 Tax=Hymenobacter algoricola TaxID=486267 RepID=A0ABP7N9S4_9BACT
MNLAALVLLAAANLAASAQTPTRPTAGAAPKNLSGLAVATFGGGCFWSCEETFEELRGVREVVAGYAGGTVKNPTYEQIGGEKTGHAESVQVYYDPRQVSYQTLLEVFFLGAHDPTQLNYQGPDTGPQYRSVAFYRSAQEKQLLETTIQRINATRHYAAPIVTQVTAFTQFWPAEAYHQGYMRLHPESGYIQHVSQPKVDKFRRAFADQLKPGKAL